MDRDLTEKSLKLFNKFNPYKGKALLHHNLRIADFAIALANKKSIFIDPDFITAACHLHDFGLFIGRTKESLYLKRSWLILEKVIRSWGLPNKECLIFRDILLYNHSLHSVRHICIGADLVRKAVQVEHSLGIVHNGLGLKYFKKVEKKYPRLNLVSILIDFARISIFNDNILSLFPMFYPNF